MWHFETWVTIVFAKALQLITRQIVLMLLFQPLLLKHGSRNIYNLTFHLLDARIYGQHIITMANGDAIDDSNEANTIDIKLSYTIF